MIVQIENWHDYRNDGEQFLHTAVAAFEKRKKAFSTETLYNLTCIAIEKFIMAFLMKNGDLADNHTHGGYGLFSRTAYEPASGPC